MAVVDLSHLAEGSLTMNSSMAAGNTVSVNPPFAPVGSESEAYSGIPLHSEPEPDLGPNNDGQLNTKRNDAGSRPVSSYTWKKT
jgi:hypothetical protein